jgi:hypothetical protein
MSTKTNFKRVALVAVAALGLGVLTSIAPASAAITAVDADTYEYLATGSIGICTAPVNSAATVAGTAHNSAKNLLQATGEVLAGGTIQFTRNVDDQIATALDAVTISVTNGSISVAAAPLNAVWGSGLTTLTQVNSSGSATSLASAFTVVASTTPGVMQVTVSRTPAASTSTTVEIYTITVSSSCATGSASVGNSIVKLGYYATVVTGLSTISTNTTEATAATGTFAAGTYEYAASATRIANGGTGYIGVRILDATASASDVTTQGVFSASATNGAVVGFDATSLALQTSTTTKAGPTTGSAQQYTLSVIQGTANKNKPISTVVSVYFNGVLYGTRSLAFTGAAAKIEISAAYSSVSARTSSAANSGAGFAAVVYEVTDSAGNLLTTDGAGISGASSGGANNSPILATSAVVVDPTQAVISGLGTIQAETDAPGGVDVTCLSTSGTAKVYLKYISSSLATISSNQYDAACAGNAVNYKASLDKASYAPGEIATLTITATDSSGKPVYDVNAIADGVYLGGTATGTGTTLAPAITLPTLTAVTAATSTDYFSGGTKTYKFTVGTTEGSFSGVVDLPKFNGTTYSQTAQTIAYKVAGAAGVSMADVLKAIVSLIASINKQIAALQKALLKK